MKLFYILALFLVNINFINATIRNVPATYPTIQLALNSCSSGDTILVMPGIYIDNITWPNISNIKLISIGDSSNTIINGNNNGRVFTFNSTSLVDTNTIIHGFQIINGYLQGSYCAGAGVFIYNCSPKFLNVLIANNRIHSDLWGYGAGLYCNNSNTIFYNSSISGNNTDSANWGCGGGVYLEGGCPIFCNVKINDNEVTSTGWNYGTGVYCTKSNPIFTNVIISGNISRSGASWYYGGGIFIEDSGGILTNVLISSNIMGQNGTWYRGGGIFCEGIITNTIKTITMMNVTVSNNYRIDGNAIYGSGLDCSDGDSINLNIINSIFYNDNNGSEIIPGGVISICYSDIRGGYTGSGNIDCNPDFISLNDFHLNINSPCINSGTINGAPTFDLDNNARPLPAFTNPDMGCYEEPFSVGINNKNNNDESFQNFPNPFNDNTTIIYYLEKPGYVQCQIIDIQGKLVVTFNDIISKSGNQSLFIDTSEYPQGTYLCKLITENDVQTIKLIKR